MSRGHLKDLLSARGHDTLAIYYPAVEARGYDSLHLVLVSGAHSARVLLAALHLRPQSPRERDALPVQFIWSITRMPSGSPSATKMRIVYPAFCWDSSVLEQYIITTVMGAHRDGAVSDDDCSVSPPKVAAHHS